MLGAVSSRPVRGASFGDIHMAGEYEMDVNDVLREIEWIDKHPKAARKMVRRALKAATAALSETAVARQAADALARGLAAERARRWQAGS